MVNNAIVVSGTIGIIGIVFAQNDFSLEDVNPASDTYGQNIGPSYFSNTVRVVGFFHEY